MTVTPFALWAAIAMVALATTASWALLFRETAIYVTSGLSFTAWSWLSLTGGDVAVVTESGVVWVRSSTASLQFVCLALAVISLVVFVMRLMGAYPSPQTNAAEAEDRNRTTAD